MRMDAHIIRIRYLLMRIACFSRDSSNRRGLTPNIGGTSAIVISLSMMWDGIMLRTVKR